MRFGNNCCYLIDKLCFFTKHDIEILPGSRKSNIGKCTLVLQRQIHGIKRIQPPNKNRSGIQAFHAVDSRRTHTIIGNVPCAFTDGITRIPLPFAPPYWFPFPRHLHWAVTMPIVIVRISDRRPRPQSAQCREGLSFNQAFESALG